MGGRGATSASGGGKGSGKFVDEHKFNHDILTAEIKGLDDAIAEGRKKGEEVYYRELERTGRDDWAIDARKLYYKQSGQYELIAKRTQKKKELSKLEKMMRLMWKEW